MADMRLAVLATVLLAIILVGELHRCTGQIHYKTPGWGPGGKRSSHMTGSNVLRKRHWRMDSQQFGDDNTEKHRRLNMLQQIANSLARKLVSPTLNDLDTARDQFIVNQFTENENDSRENDWN